MIDYQTVFSLQKFFVYRIGLAVFPFVFSLVAIAHEGHQPLPTKGVQIDFEQGHLTLSKQAREILDVQAVEVSTEGIPKTFRAYATVVAPWMQHAFATTRLAGRIANVTIQPGQEVVAGQLVAELESRELQTLRLEYQKAENDLALATKLESLVGPAAESGSIAGQRWIEAKNTLQQARNAMSVLQAKLQALGLAEEFFRVGERQLPLRLPILSPISGTIIHADLAIGKYVEPTEHLIEIVDTSSVWIQSSVLEKDLDRVKLGQTMKAKFSGFPNKVFEALVDRRSSYLDPVSQLGLVWATYNNTTASQNLIPGQRGQAEFINTGEKTENVNRLSVPRGAIFSDGAQRYVFVEEAFTKETSEYQKRPIVPGNQAGDSIEIIGGQVYPGDRVVARGGHELSNLFFLGVLKVSPEAAKTSGLQISPVNLLAIDQVIPVDAMVDLDPRFRTEGSSHLSGTLSAIHVDRGEQVKQGQLLAEVQSITLQDMQLEWMKAHLDSLLWRDTAIRTQSSGDAVSRRLVIESESKARDAELRYSNLIEELKTIGLTESQLSKVLDTKKILPSVPVIAPSNGVIARFDRVLGQSIRADEPLFEIHDNSQVIIRGFVPSRDISQVKIGQPSRVRFVATGDQEYNADVVRMGPVVTNNNQSIWLRLASMPAIPLQYRMLATANLITQTSPPTLAVPNSAIIDDGLQSFVFVQKPDSTFERRRVVIGITDDRHSQITSGLTVGELVANRGVSELQTAYASLR